MRRRRLLLLGVATLLSASALLAIGILLVGRFGHTEQRILGTTMLLAGYGLLALPSVVLLDQGRFRRLAQAGLVASAVAAGLAVASIWGASGGDTLGRLVGTATVTAIAIAQAAALAARRQAGDPVVVRRLFTASCVLAVAGAAVATALLWANPRNGVYPRLLGALVILDLLVVALQPILARARPAEEEHRFSVALSTGERVEISIVGGEVATAAAKAIRAAERSGGHVVRLDVASAPQHDTIRSSPGIREPAGQAE